MKLLSIAVFTLSLVKFYVLGERLPLERSDFVD